METIYGSLKNVFQNLKNEIAEDLLLYSFVLVLFSIPLPYFYNSIAIALFVSVALFNRVKERVKIPIALVFPVLLYLLMVLSLLWSVDLQGSLRALSKGIPLLLIPICFLISPKLRESQKQKIIRFYGYGILVYSIFCLGNAGVRFLLFKNIAVFFYHELVTIDVNAIHVSVYVSLAFFSFLIKTNKSIIDQLALFILTVFLVLLSSKNVSIIFLFLFLVYLIGHTKSESRKKLFAYGFVLISLSLLVFSGKIKERFLIEYQSNSDEKTVNTEISTENGIVYNVSIKRAWSQEYFQANDYFPGTSFRVYQLRIFLEMLKEDCNFFTGYGLNATDFKIEQKSKEHNLHEGYTHKNFHNEYIQIFAELGFFGFCLILILLAQNIRNAIKMKDFIHISFAVLMISLFLTESFLSRQRGIIFFTMFYCLFNSGNAPKLRTKSE